MQLFDIINKLNSEISVMMNEGMPGYSHPMLLAETDGFHARIKFLDRVVWDSETWEYGNYSHALDDSEKERYETAKIEQSIKKNVTDWIDKLYFIQWD